MSDSNFNLPCNLCNHLQKSKFSGLSEEDFQRINTEKTCEFYKKGQTIFYEGARPKGLYCVSEGKIKVSKINSDGKEYILYIAKSADFLGYRALLGEEYYSASAEALEDSKVCFIPKLSFFELLNKNPTFMLKVVKGMCYEMGILGERLTELAHKTVKERLAANLLMLKETYGVEGEGSALIDIALSRDDLAGIVGTSSETIIRLLAEYKKEGLITYEGKKIRVVDGRQLAHSAGLLAR